MDDTNKQLFKDGGVSDEAIQILENQEITSPADIQGMSYNDFVAMGIKAKSAKALEKMATPPVSVPEVTPASTTPSMDILPSVPDDTSFLEMLKVGGVLKIQPVDVIAAMRAAIASSIGLYDLPDQILARMEQFAQQQEEPVGTSFYELQKLITTRAYGDVLSAMGVSGNFMSERRKKETLQRLNDGLWPALREFHEQLVAWSDAWQKGANNPGAALMVFALASSGNRGVLPPGMLQPPETAGLRDEAEAVINRINKVFAGTGIPVARALAYDAVRIRTILEDPSLPAAVGAANKDQMLKTLGINVGADFVRLERNLVRYALAVMELPKVTTGTEEYSYLGALLTLGLAIPWDKLTGGTIRNVDDEQPAVRRRSGYERGGETGSSGRGFRE